MIALIAAVVVPIYSFGVYDFPHQMNEDEVTIMTVSREVSTAPASDILGPSNYFGFPVLIFWIYGKLGVAMGGLNLGSMRTLHALSGALIVVLSYCLFRQLFDQLWAVTATVILGLNHSLFFISRMAMRDNSALLFELLALVLLLYGWQKRSLVWSFWGGIASGLTFYVYYPSRMTIFIWFAGVLIYGAVHSFRKTKTELPMLGVAVLGLLLTIGPTIIGSFKTPEPKGFFEEHVLLLPAGRAVQQRWVSAKTEQDGIFINIRNGLLTFNKPYSDLGYIYNHPGFGFVDRYTGMFIWLGLAAVIVAAWRKHSLKLKEMLMIVGFLVTWLSLTFVFNKAPDYTRLLTTLPFVAYMATNALVGLATILKKYVGGKQLLLSSCIALLGVGLVGFSNVAIAKDFYNQGKADNSGLANTARLLEKHRQDLNSKWYFAPSSPNSYFAWGDESSWRYWLSFFLNHQPLVIIHPYETNPFTMASPVEYGNNYLLTNRDLWDYSLKKRFPYPVKDLSSITPDGHLIVVRF